ncbi:voltage-dependent anion channel [Rhodocollybia butyracea]|uniref:Voltage-dependent anion channel n=1 Tax=Rhodocollybia butyracea TaxID=206335 RepID=A0A9P5PYF9_9AGAR|nr:voltage-dependent anion channel [Rhodocollybia butyracea]
MGNTRTQSLRDSIRNFVPAWFTAIMGTGAISLLFHIFPYGTGSKAFIAWTLVFFFLNLTLFIVISVMTAARYIIYPKMWALMINHPSQSLFVGTCPIGMCSLLSIAVSVVSDKYNFGGAPFLYAMWACWWLVVAMSVLCCWGIVHLMQKSQKYSLQNMTTIWLLPVVTLVVGSSTGGLFAQALKNSSHASHALVTQVVSLFMLTIGLCLASTLLGVYIQRLIIVGMPHGLSVLSVFIPLGATGQAGYSFILAGEFFQDLLPLEYGDSGLLTDPSTGRTINTIFVCIAFALWALASMWMMFGVLAILDELRTTRIPFKVNYWGLIFPNGVYANLTIILGNTFDSPFFRVWGSIYAVITLLLWCFVATKTIQSVYNGTMFEIPKEEEISLQLPVVSPQTSMISQTSTRY